MAIPKRDFAGAAKKQIEEKKENNLILENKDLKKDNDNLIKRIKELENIQPSIGSGSDFPIEDIILIDNIRSELENDALIELKDSIQANGQLQPVLITKDKRLIAGFRRYTAIQLLGYKTISAYVYNKNYSDIKDEIKFLQFEENERRKSIDNFDIAKVFQDCIKDGYDQATICEVFRKSKGYVSSVLRLMNMDKQMIDYVRQFQMYAYSEKKFTTVNSENNIQENKFYQKNRGVIGWNTLYSIAKHEDISEQKKAFLKSFKNRLTEDELNSKYFKKEYNELIKLKDNSNYKSALKSVDSLKVVIDNIMENIDESDYEDFNAIRNYLLATEEILINKSEKIK